MSLPNVKEGNQDDSGCFFIAM